MEMKVRIISGRCGDEPVEQGNSIVEEKIRSKDFLYLQPYFYKHPFALRCELGIGDTTEEYMANANRRAQEIYDILFPHGADAIMFNYWLYDPCDSGSAEISCYDEEDDIAGIIDNRVEAEAEKIRFVSKYQMKYRHFTVRNVATEENPECCVDDRSKRNRVICYSDGIGFDHKHLIAREIDWNGHEVSFVSFENECILSVYDDRGCDIVFMTHEKMRQFYHKLQPYFLEWDIPEMEIRYNG